MISEPRTIARILELLHIPTQHTPDQLRDVYMEVSRSCGYENFIRTGNGARLETTGAEPGSFSRLTFANDRIGFHEEHNNMSLENFLRRIQEVVRVTTSKLAIPVFVARNVTLRALAGAPRGKQGSQFLAENLFQLTAEEWGPFGRPGQIHGFRLQFPPTDPKGGIHQVRIENYVRDPRSLFVEDWCTFKAPVQAQDMGQITTELREVEDFLHERIYSFLNQYPRS